MAVASLVGCSFCLDLGYFQAHNEGLDVAKAREVPRWRESDVFTPLERDVMEYAEAMTADPAHGHRRAVGRGCSTQLGAAALVELTAFIALANLVHPHQHRARHRVAGLLGGLRPASRSPCPSTA